MKREFNVIIEHDSDGYYVASVPALKGCHTQAESLDTLMERIKEAGELCLEVEADYSSDLQFIGIQRIAVGQRPILGDEVVHLMVLSGVNFLPHICTDLLQAQVN